MNRSKDSKNFWKIERDFFYKSLYDMTNEETILEAGFFYDTDTVNRNLKESIKILCTPLSFLNINTNISKSPNGPCILLTCGAFCPLHPGHIQMMEVAKKHLEGIGYDVIGGYISPGHDEYISSKNKDKAIPIHYRIRIISQMIKHKDWLSVDPWEGLFCKVAVNFTDVYLRLQMYIKEHLKQDIPIFFVSGGDNAKFAMTFLKKGNCIIV